MYNHVLQYTTQKRETQHPYDTFQLRSYGTVPKYPDPVPKQTVLAGAGIRLIPLSPDPALLPSPPLLGVSRVTAVQIHPTISCSVRAGSTRQTVPRNRPPRRGFTQQSKRDRSATWWPGDIHTRPSVRFTHTGFYTLLFCETHDLAWEIISVSEKRMQNYREYY